MPSEGGVRETNPKRGVVGWGVIRWHASSRRRARGGDTAAWQRRFCVPSPGARVRQQCPVCSAPRKIDSVRLRRDGVGDGSCILEVGLTASPSGDRGIYSTVALCIADRDGGSLKVPDTRRCFLPSRLKVYMRAVLGSVSRVMAD